MITVEDIAYVRYAVRDLDAALAFMTDFGLHLSARTDSAIDMRVDVGPAPVGGFRGVRDRSLSEGMIWQST